MDDGRSADCEAEDDGSDAIFSPSVRRPGVIVALKAVIVLLWLVSAIGQFWVLPVMSGEFAVADPSYAYLRIPYLVLSVGIIGCFEAALIALWHLLSMTGRGSVFSLKAFGWVDMITWCAVVAAVLTVVLLVHSMAVGTGPLLFDLILAVVVMIEVAFILLMVVMRALLRTATAQRDELQAVI